MLRKTKSTKDGKAHRDIDYIAKKRWRQIGLDKNSKLNRRLYYYYYGGCGFSGYNRRGVSFKDVIYIAAYKGVRNTL